MNLDIKQIAGILVIFGSALFILAALPIGGKVYSSPDVGEKLQIISANPRGWFYSQIMFFFGGLITPVGFYLWSIHIAPESEYHFIRVSAWLMAMGFLGWAVYVIHRAYDPPSAYDISALFRISLIFYFILTDVALAILGVAILRLGFGTWLGYGSIGLAILFATVAVVAGGGFPPLLFYIPTLAMGIVLLSH